ncbi:hypothetical protein [Pseudovibrio sp. Ad37]|uniref:hypothetical protein n=1 Tax=Pseudovibrio sp. Ad37 TaxID=989422 RepID=UPI0007AE8782|nr:hypothetical protein [Pseudovibrio sp. Ad37]KZL19914.1 hypothetical protein PsAD37_03635 [Pseudovibrio sp. Ad37]
MSTIKIIFTCWQAWLLLSAICLFLNAWWSAFVLAVVAYLAAIARHYMINGISMAKAEPEKLMEYNPTHDHQRAEWLSGNRNIAIDPAAVHNPDLH